MLFILLLKVFDTERFLSFLKKSLKFEGYNAINMSNISIGKL